MRPFESWLFTPSHRVTLASFQTHQDDVEGDFIDQRLTAMVLALPSKDPALDERDREKPDYLDHYLVDDELIGATEDDQVHIDHQRNVRLAIANTLLEMWDDLASL